MTLTTPDRKGIPGDVKRFVDHLQTISTYLPLRTIPLEVQVFGVVKGRLNEVHLKALENQHVAIDAWQDELEERFSPEERERNICDVPL